MAWYRRESEKSFFHRAVGSPLVSSRQRTVFSAGVSLAINIAYAVYNCFLGISMASAWFFTMCFYYTVLGVMRFWTILYAKVLNRPKDANESVQKECIVMKRVGVVILFLIPALSGTVILTIEQNHVKTYDTIMMLTIATYTFYKIIMAVLNYIKARQKVSPLLGTIRSIGTAEAAMSILPLQSSMLVTFNECGGLDRPLMTVLTGSGICAFLLWLGISMIVSATKRSKQYGKIKAR